METLTSMQHNATQLSGIRVDLPRLNEKNEAGPAGNGCASCSTLGFLY